MESRIHINTDLEKASFTRQTIFDYKSDAKGALDYYALAQEIARKCMTKPKDNANIEQDEDLPAHEPEEALVV